MKTTRALTTMLAAICGITATAFAETDENGLTPYVWYKFDESTDSCGTITPWSQSMSSAYAMSREGFASKNNNGYGNGMSAGTDGNWSLTVCAKVSSSDNSTIFAIGTRKERGIALASGGTDKVTVSLWESYGEHSDKITATVADSSSKYHFYALVVEGGTKAKLYVDGVLYGSEVDVSGNPGSGQFQFGSIYGGMQGTNPNLNKSTSNVFDDVRFYQVALTAEQVSGIAATFPVWSDTGSIAAGDTLTLYRDTSFAALTVGAGATIDLNGHDLRVGTVDDTTFSANKLYTITNSNDETLGTVTCGIGNGKLGFNKNAIFGGNLRYVITGSDETHFRDSGNTRDDAIVANTHTGGTVVSNKTGNVRYYGNPNIGTGNLSFYGPSKLWMPSNYLLSDRYNFSKPVYVTGEGNSFALDANAGDTASFEFHGGFIGDGELILTSGYRHTVTVRGDMSQFTGTLNIALNPETKSNADTIWLRGKSDITNGLEHATLMLSNKTENAVNSINLKPNEGGTQTFKIGHLVTAGSNAEEYANTQVRDCCQWSILTLQVGGANKSGTYAGNFVTESANNANGSHWALEKVGSGTWTLTGSTFNFNRELKVSEGRLNFDTTYNATAISVASGATLGGTGTIGDNAPITLASGAMLAGSLTAASVTFNSGSQITVAADALATTTVSTDVDGTAITVNLTGTLDITQEYAILTAGGGSSGKATVVTDDTYTSGTWKTKWVANQDGSKTLTGYFVKQGFLIIFR